MHELSKLEQGFVMGSLIAGFWFVLSILYAAFAWIITKIFTHEKGLVIPLFQPPYGVSPAGAGYILNGTVDAKACMASIMNMKVKGFISITKTGNDYELKKLKKEYDDLYDEERVFAQYLFLKSDTIILQDIYQHFVTVVDTKLDIALFNFKEKLKENYDQYISVFHLWVYGSGFITLLALFTIAIPLDLSRPAYIATTLAGVFFVFSITGIIEYIKTKKKGNLTVVILCIIFVIISYYLYFQNVPVKDLSPIIIVPFVFLSGLIYINIFLARLPILYIGKKRKMRNDLNGFKLFLTTSESERYKILENPDETQLFNDKLLPYAIALGVETEWVKRVGGELSLVGFVNEEEVRSVGFQRRPGDPSGPISYYEEQSKKGNYTSPAIPGGGDHDKHNEPKDNV
jgi:hypothetical protein